MPERDDHRETLQVAYHVSPAANRDSILGSGLDAARNPRGGYLWTGDVAGQYLFSTRRAAGTAAARDFVDADIFEVDVSGLVVEGDGRMPHAVVVREPIPPGRVRHAAHTVYSPEARWGRRVCWTRR